MITVTHLVKAFNGKDILKDINVTFPKGKTTVIIGPSGSGKTTLLRCLNLLETPTEGSIAFDLDFYQFSEKTKLSTERVLNLRRKSGMVFQSFNLFPHKTVEQNIIEGPVIVKKQDKNLALAKAAELLKKVGLSDRAQHYPHQLSGGQKQRVAIARALAMEPEVILFDEPTSALDPELEMEVLRVIKDLATEHNTMIIVTHNMDFARTIADYVIFIEAGKIVEAGEKAQVFGHPKEKRTQEFLRLFSKSQFE
jgi:cystine transport system ATP-binding protein